MNNSDFFKKEYSANMNKYLQADGEQSSAQDNSTQKVSGGVRTYIIKVVNSCSSAISNVDIGDAANNRMFAGDAQTGPYNTNLSITLTCPVSDITYNEFLATTEEKPFTVGTTVIISTSSGQLSNTSTITHRDIAGNRLDHVISPTLDRFQTQTDRVLEDYEYLFDGMTRIRLSSINANATVTVRLYAKNNFSATQIIAGRDGDQSYSAPNMVKPILTQN